MHSLTTLLRPLAGSPPALPPTLDRCAEWWAARTPRTRMAIVVAGVLLLLAVAGAGAARSPWGAGRTVLVAGRDLAPGATLRAADVHTERWPAAILPPDALTAVPAEDDALLALGAPAGTVLTERHLAADGLAAHLGADRAAVPVPRSEGLPVRAGQLVDLVAGDGQGRGQVLARDARVLRVGETTLWVDVSRDDAPSVAAAVDWGEVTVAVVGPHAG